MTRETTTVKARGSTTNRPIMVLFDVLGQRWTMRILWELRAGPLVFRELQRRCGGVSPSVLNKRLKTLNEMRLISHVSDQGYGLTTEGKSLGNQLLRLHDWAERWAAG